MNTPTIAILDVDYRDYPNGHGTAGYGAGIWFQGWESDVVYSDRVIVNQNVAPYVPGAFYQRELPCLLSLMTLWKNADIIVIDGYVWLPEQQKGLGAYLYDSMGIPVVGIGKTHYAKTGAIPVLRGSSTRPLYVTSEGIDTQTAAECVAKMAGEFRLPEMVKKVDRMARAIR